MISVFGVILPSMDQGSDYYTIAWLIDNGFECNSRCGEPDQEEKEDSRVRSKLGSYKFFVQNSDHNKQNS